MNKLNIIFFVGSSIYCCVAFAANPTLQNSVEKYDPGITASDLKARQTQPPMLPEPQIKVENNKPESMISSEDHLKFKLNKIILSGNKAIPTQQLAKLYKNKLNTEITLTDLEEIAQSITDYYRNADFVLSQALIPAQEIGSDNTVKLNIVEGYIDKVEFTGCTRENVCDLLKAYGGQIKKVIPLTLNALERFAFLANDIPGSNVRVVITRSMRAVGAADLTFIVNEKNYAGNITYNNYNSAVLGRQQLIANATAYNLATASQTNINGTVSRNIERLKYMAITHRQQLNANGLGCSMALSKIKTNPNLEQIGLNGYILPGEAVIATANIDYAKIRSHKKNLYLGAGVKFLNSNTKFGTADLFKDNVRSVNVSVIYNFLQGINTSNLITVSFSQGIKVFNANNNPPSRVGERLDFSKFEISATNWYRFANPRLSYVLAIKAQYALNTVPSSETFGYGGVPFGYGYDPSEISGDRGIAGRLELQCKTYSMPKTRLFSQVFAFLDGGYVASINKNIQPTTQSGVSTGLGHRINTMDHIAFEFTVGVPLKPIPASNTKHKLKLLLNLRIYG